MKTTFSNSIESCLHWNCFDHYFLLLWLFNKKEKKSSDKISSEYSEVVEIHAKKGSMCEDERTCCEQPTETGLCRLSSFPKWLSLGTGPRFSPNVPLFEQWNYTVGQILYFIRFFRIVTQAKQKQKSTLYFPGKKQANLIWDILISSPGCF